MHPIISEFINTDNRLPAIIEKYHDKNNFLEKTFLKLQNSINFKDIDPQLYIEIDQAIIKGHPDTNVYLLFIFFTVRFTSFRRQFERANVIQSIGYSLNQDEIHPIIQSLFINSVATLKSFESKWNECNRLMKESIALFDKTNHRYISVLMGTANLLAQQGRLKELEKDDLNRLDAVTNDQLAFTIVGAKLMNSILTCNYKEGFALLEDYRRLYRGDLSVSVMDMENLLKIISGDFDEKDYQEPGAKVYIKILRSLSNANFEEASNQFQILQKSTPLSLLNYRFSDFLPLHIELCLKNKGKARLILHEIKEIGEAHYFEDFFHARLQLLEMNREGAIETFSRLIENLNRYDAMNLLTFELQFAKELMPSDILMLMNGVEEHTELKANKSNKIPTPSLTKTGKGLELLVGQSPLITQVKELVKKFAKLKVPVLITGETGTGKELVSRAIHDEGPFPSEPFLAINCGALTESLLQSELFGYVASAFTGAQREKKGIFEAAGNGTVFLDEFGDISPQMQVSLLRVLESNEIRLIGGTKTRIVECKIVIATNVDLQKAVEEKKFREDLFFRLTRFDIKLPTLRDRKEDIPQLIEYFLGLNKDSVEKNQKLSSKLLDALATYHWSGNIRELKNEIERMKILHAEKEVLNIEDFDFTRLADMPPIISKQDIKIETKKITKQKIKLRDFELDHDKILNIVQRGTKAETRKKVIRELFQNYKKITRSQIVEITAINPGLVSKELQSLCDAGFIKRITPTKSVKSHYFVLNE